MYGVKRIEYDDYRTVKAIEFYEGIPSKEIIKAMKAIGLKVDMNYLNLPVDAVSSPDDEEYSLAEITIAEA